MDFGKPNKKIQKSGLVYTNSLAGLVVIEWVLMGPRMHADFVSPGKGHYN